jgi:ABC-type glycerol-3-phosphate transport system substrate-binding protein
MRRRSNVAKRAVGVVGAVSAVALLAACAGPAETEGGDSDSFTYWSMWREDEPVAKVLQEAVASFEEETGIAVDVQWQGRDVLTKLKAALNTSNIPDLVDQGFPAMKAAIGISDQALDLTPVYDMEVSGDDGRTVRDVVPEAYDKLNTAETLMMVPYYVSAFSWWFSGRDYPDLVTSPPASWDDFVALFPDVKAAGQAPIAQDADLISYDSSFVNSALVRALGPGGLHEVVSDPTGESWDAPDIEAALSAIASLAENDDYLPGYDSSKFPAMEKAWAQSEAAFLYMGSWVPYSLGPDLAEDYDLRTFNFPTLVGDTTAVPVTTYGYSIPSAADDVEPAQEFIAYVLGTEWLTKLSTDAQILTPDPAIEVPEVLRDQQAMLANNELYLNDDGIAADYPDLTTRLGDLNQRIITGQLDAEGYIAEATTMQKQFWELNG